MIRLIALAQACIKQNRPTVDLQCTHSYSLEHFQNSLSPILLDYVKLIKNDYNFTVTVIELNNHLSSLLLSLFSQLFPHGPVYLLLHH